MLTVTNPVDGCDGDDGNRGHGLVGMRERVTLLDGQLETGRRGATFRLRATLPYRRAAA